METQSSLEMYEKTPVNKLVLKNAVPAMAAMLMVLIYNLADTLFIGFTHDALQVAAVSLASPVFVIFVSVGTVFGIGGTSVISRSIGEGKTEYARKVCSFCMWGCVVVGIALAILVILFIDPILSLVGASADTWEYAKTYLTIVSLSGPFVLVANCYNNIIRAEGQSTKAMMGQLLGNLLNVILDPIFISGFGMEIAGAAIATVIGNVAGACYYILYFVRGKSMLSIHPRDFTIKNKVCTNVLRIGVPAALGSLMMSFSQIIVNSLMSAYGDMAVAGIGVATKVTMITSMVSLGFGQGVQPVLGYYVGARNWKRFKDVMKFSTAATFCLSVVMTGLCYLFAPQLVKAFLSDETAYGFALQFVRILLSTSFIFGVFYVFVNALQAMGAAVESFVVNISRQGIIYIPALFILRAVMGITGLLWAQPVADVLSTVIVFILYRRTSHRLMQAKAQIQ